MTSLLTPATPEPFLNRTMDRRALLKAGLGLGAVVALSGLLPRSAMAALAAQPSRQLAIANLHTGESCALVYWENGIYIPEALKTVQRVMRDHRNGAEHAMHPALLDVLSVLHARLETTTPYELISGYRSPESNAAMHANSNGVAKHSMHMEGKATDIRVRGRALQNVHATALTMGMGGVGYYPSSNFVHVDTGKVRQWTGA